MSALQSPALPALAQPRRHYLQKAPQCGEAWEGRSSDWEVQGVGEHAAMSEKTGLGGAGSGGGSGLVAQLTARDSTL